MAGDLLLDTNVVIAIFNRDQLVVEKVQSYAVFLPTVVLGELYYGAYASSRVATNLTRLEEFASQVAVMAVSRFTGSVYGKIKNQLRAAGRPIPDNDIWIAAVAVQHGFTLATRDDHFRHIDGLEVVYW